MPDVPRSPGRAVVLAPGPWDPGADRGPGGSAVGFFVTDGLISRDLLLGSGVASDLLGPGDFAGLDADAEDAFLPVETQWVVCADGTQVSYLDESLVAALRRRPLIAARLLARAAQQANRQAVHRALSQLPRVEQRILALLWLLAERWGRVAGDGIVVPVALTHEALGRMVGARRPTVSLALKGLDEQGLVRRRDDRSWVLRPGSVALLGADAEAGPAPTPESLLAHVPPTEDDGATTVAAPPANGRLSTTEELADRVEQLSDEHEDSRLRMQELIAQAAPGVDLRDAPM